MSPGWRLPASRLAGGDRRWLRRNWWAVALLVPLLAALVVLSPDDSYQRWRSLVATSQAAADGWVEYRDVRLRLSSVEPADLRQPATDEPFALPDGLRAWLATVTVDLAGAESLTGCELLLEDGTGRVFGDGPAEAGGARVGPGGSGHSQAICQPGDGDPPGQPFEVVGLFVMPASAEPAAVRVTAFADPGYARLPAD